MIKGVHAMFYSDQADALRAKGVKFVTDIEDHGFGFVTVLEMPGGIQVQLYQPKYPKNR